MSAPPERLRHYIRGAWHPSASDRWIADVNPSDASDLIAHVPEGTADDVNAAVTAAAEALEAWRSLAAPVRAEHLYKWSSVIADQAESLAQLVTREVGKPIAEARGEVLRSVTILRYHAGEAVRAVGEVIPPQLAGALQYTIREPLGVVALITPWNFPVAIPIWKSAPALALGNTVVLKPSEMSSQVATALAATAAAAGLPAGVFNVVFGTGATVGRSLIDAAPVRAVSFTGSGAVGAEVAVAAARRNIRFQTEMGGKNAAIVLPDADLAHAAALTAAGAMRYAGQKCTATSRVVVAKEVETAFLAELRKRIEALPLGPVTDAGAAVGPVISEQSRDSARGALAALDTDVFYVGRVPETAEFSRGYWVPPTVYRNVGADTALAQKELFAPVLAAFTADDLDHAIALANGTPYGLSASLFTRDIRSALHYIPRIEAGLVKVNGETTGVDPHAPFGGMKGSSSGSREQGPAARDFYTEIKTVQINP